GACRSVAARRPPLLRPPQRSARHYAYGPIHRERRLYSLLGQPSRCRHQSAERADVPTNLRLRASLKHPAVSTAPTKPRTPGTTTSATISPIHSRLHEQFRFNGPMKASLHRAVLTFGRCPFCRRVFLWRNGMEMWNRRIQCIMVENNARLPLLREDADDEG